jgi:MFS family permease
MGLVSLARAAWPGLGLCGESFLIFSIGTMPPLWDAVFFSNADDDDAVGHPRDAVLHMLSYSVVSGVIIGMIVLGYAADKVGRRVGSLITASLMVLGAIGLTAVAFVGGEQHQRARQQITDGNASFDTKALSAESIASLFHWLALSFFVLGLGVGGEYPLSSASAAEKSMTSLCRSSTNDNSSRSQQPARITQANKITLTQNHDPLIHPDSIDFSPPTVAAEGAPTNNIRVESSDNRGQQMQIVFTMQGIGIFLHCLLLMLLLGVNAWTGRLQQQSEYYDSALLQTWQILYCIGAGILLVVLLTRLRYLEESIAWKTAKVGNRTEVWMHSPLSVPVAADPLTSANENAQCALDEHQEGNNDRKRENVCSRQRCQRRTPWVTYRLLSKHYGVRLFAVSASWFLWDVAFYGNKLFQSAFLLSLTAGSSVDADEGKSDLVLFAAAATANAAVALAGYVAAAFIIDHPAVGRQRLQQWGFLVTGSLFVCVGLWLNFLPTPALIALYFLSSFFGQLGPNATTFIIPAEIFPTKQRTLCHGIAAASGKMGALAAAVVFGSNHLSRDTDRFLYSGYASLVAAAITFVFIPETVGFDLNDNDRHWKQVISATGEQGWESNDGGKSYREGWEPRFLSLFERHQQQQKSLSSSYNDFHAANDAVT